MGLIEECVGVDGTILNEVLIPMMNVDRRCMDGTVHGEETLNKSQIYVTTAGWKNTFPYDKLITLLVRMATEPEKAMVMGGTWRIPVLMGLQSKNFVDELKQDDTFNEASFSREYESRWSGTVENSFFNAEIFNRNRQIQLAEYEPSKKASKYAYYVISADVGRKGCDTVITVFKVTPQPSGPSVKSIVNIYTMSDAHMEDQAIKLKKLYYKFNAERLVIDANGLGIGLVDYMVKSQTDPDTGDILPDFGVYNDPDQYYKQYKTKVTELDAMYLMKAHAGENTEAHATLKHQMQSGKIKFLVDERVAQNKLLSTKRGQTMTPEERAEYLKPFQLTSILREELMNLREENEGVNIILRQVNKSIPKDKFSSLEYGVYYIKIEEDSKRKRRKKFKASDWTFMN